MIYLDNNSTTRVSPDIVKSVCDCLSSNYANASSRYPLGLKSKEIIEDSRKRIKKILNASLTDNLVFTGCASESNNTVFFSATNSFPEKKHIIVSAVEHMSVLKTAQFYKSKGYELSIIDVDSDGNLNIDQFSRAIRNDTVLVSIMLANNETGVIFPVKELVTILKKKNPDSIFHTDAVQAIGKIPVDVNDLGVDFLSLSGHKFHAPKGVGALYIKNGLNFTPFIVGGHQEDELRAGTESVANIKAIGEAAINVPHLIEENSRREQLRNWMEERLLELDDIEIIGKRNKRLPNTSNISAKNISGDTIMLKLANKGICVSTGSACNSVCVEASHVLKAMHIPKEYLYSIRVSFSDETIGSEVNTFVDCYSEIINKRR